jgi:hypothetical protein
VRSPIRVTFDSNTYSVVGRPQLSRLSRNVWPPSKQRLKSMRNRLCWWYLNWCIRRGRIIAGIPEGALKAEVLRNNDRLTALLAVGTPAAAALPEIAPTRQQIIAAAFATGFVVLRSPRISWGTLVAIPEGRRAPDTVHTQADRLNRESAFVRHFGNDPFEALKDYVERLSAAHELATPAKRAEIGWIAAGHNVTVDRLLWREALAAEASVPIVEPSVEAFQKRLRTLLADWVDFDVAAAHYAYGYDILCSDDRGTNLTSIFSPNHAATLRTNFGVTVLNVLGLTSLCLRTFWFPICKWDHPG